MAGFFSRHKIDSVLSVKIPRRHSNRSEKFILEIRTQIIAHELKRQSFGIMLKKTLVFRKKQAVVNLNHIFHFARIRPDRVYDQKSKDTGKNEQAHGNKNYLDNLFHKAHSIKKPSFIQSAVESALNSPFV